MSDEDLPKRTKKIMGRRTKPYVRLQKAIDAESPDLLMWALLELAVREFKTDGTFKTLKPQELIQLCKQLSTNMIERKKLGEEVKAVAEEQRLSNIQEWLKAKKSL